MSCKRDNGPDALVLALQQETILGNDIHPLIVSGIAVREHGRHNTRVKAHLSAKAVVPDKINHRAAFHHGRFVVPAVHHLRLTAARRVHESVVVHIYFKELVAKENQEIAAHLVVLTDRKTGVHTQFSPTHRIGVEVHEEFLRHELSELNIPFSETVKVVCEEFELAYA